MGDTITDIGKTIWKTADDHGFHDARRDFGLTGSSLAALCLIHSEVSEAMEALRKPEAEHGFDPADQYLMELADVLIRVLDEAHEFQRMNGFPEEAFAAIVQRKMEVNAARPKMHGGRAF